MIGVYPGSFDPLTLGHYDIILRASKLCDTLYIAVSENISKTPLFTIDERVEMIRESLSGISNVKVESFNGLLVDYMKKKGAGFIIRGMRAVSDFEYEFQMALANRNLFDTCETLFMVPDSKYVFLSSTIVRDISRHGGDISNLVTEPVMRKLKEKFK